MQPRFSRLAHALPLALYLAGPAHAAFRIVASKASVQSGHTVHLTLEDLEAGEARAAAPDWKWSIEGFPESSLTAGSGVERTFTAPLVAKPTRTQLTVCNLNPPHQHAVLELEVLPDLSLPLSPRVAQDKVVDSQEFRPGLQAIRTLEGILPDLDLSVFPIPIRFVEDEAMGKLNRKLLLGTTKGLHAMDMEGKVELLAETKGQPIYRLAVCPTERSDQALRALYLTQVRKKEFLTGRSLLVQEVWAYRRGQDKASRLATFTFANKKGLVRVSGPWSMPSCTPITDLALDDQGRIHLICRNEVWRLTPGNKAPFLVAGVDHCPGIADGYRLQARFTRLRSGAYDSATGDLYVLDDCHCVRRIAANGDVTTVLGRPINPKPRPYFVPPPLGEPAAGTDTCLGCADDLQILGNHLLIPLIYSKTIIGYHLRDQTVTTLVDHERLPYEPKLGPLRSFTAAVTEEEAGHLGSRAHSLATTREGLCFATCASTNKVYHHVATLDFSPLLPNQADRRNAVCDERKETASAEAAPAKAYAKPRQPDAP